MGLGIFKLGGIGSPCCCGGGTPICVTECTGNPVAGALVELRSGTTLVASCTTDATGCCTFAQTGTYAVRVTVSGTIVSSGSRTLSGTTITIGITDTNVVCCGGVVVPKLLTLTDSIGSLPFSYNGTSGGTATWSAAATHTATGMSQPVNFAIPGNCSSGCTWGTPSNGSICVDYQMTCTGTSPQFSVRRSWSSVNPGTGPVWFQDSPPCLFGCLGSGGGTVLTCNSFYLMYINDSGFDADATSTGPFTLVGTPAFIGGNTGDPVGGSVAIS